MKICCALLVPVLLAVWAASGIAVQNTDETRAFVPSNLPIYVHGQKLDPRDGGHLISLDREKGLMIDDVLYLPLQKYRPYVPAVESEGLHYFAESAARIGSDALKTGGVEAAREAMLKHWSKYADSLKVTQIGKYEYELTYHGSSAGVAVPEVPFEPEKQQPDNFEHGLKPRFRSIVSRLEKGYILLLGMTYFLEIKESDAARVIPELTTVARRARIKYTVGDEVIYRHESLADGKYRLGSAAVADFVANENK